jgi:translation initiation factor IF-3
LQKFRINHQIQAPTVRVISEAGAQLGILKLSEALKLAEEHNLDLVEISPRAQPPVVKLIGFDKFRYQQKKLEQQHKKKAKKIEVKTIRLSARISEHDLMIKAKQANEFLSEGNLVKIELRMRGREQAFADLAQSRVQTFQKLLTVPFRVEVPQRRQGPIISLTVAPSKSQQPEG